VRLRPQIVSSSPADWTPHVLDGRVDAAVQVGNTMIAGGQFTKLNGVAPKSLAKLRLSDGGGSPPSTARPTPGSRAVSNGRLYIGGTFSTSTARPARDSASRWETGATGGGQQPTWADFTGGDTLYGVAITGTAVHLGGHQRWINNSFAADRAGPGAVAREGLAGGTPVPESRVGTLPGDLFRIGTDNATTRRAFDGATAGSGTPLALDGLTSTQHPQRPRHRRPVLAGPSPVCPQPPHLTGPAPRPAPRRCGLDQFRYPAPRQPL
jgi:hypothetical protein